MKILALMLTLAALAGLAQAQGSPPEQTVTITGAALRFKLPDPPYKMREGEFRDVAGQYDMAGGKTLTVSRKGRALFAEFEGLPRTEMVAAAPNVLVARNNQMKMVFEQAANGVVSGVTLTYVQPQEARGQRRPAPK